MISERWDLEDKRVMAVFLPLLAFDYLSSGSWLFAFGVCG